MAYKFNNGSTLTSNLVPKDQFYNTGTLWGWGGNGDGQIGDGTAIERSSPVQTVAGGTDWRSLAVGLNHTAAIKTDGTLWMCGYNRFSGMLGTGDSTNRSSPVQTICGGADWKQVSCGSNHTAAIKTDGTLWTWGNNFSGQLGNNATTSALTSNASPVQTVCGGNNWLLVSCGYSSFAIKTDGTLWVWGSNSNGQLGDNSTSSKSSPVQTVAGGTNWKHASCGNSHTAAIKTDGTLWTWGGATLGCLGNNTSAGNLPSPVQTVAGGTNWKHASCGPNRTAAIKTDGTLWVWGSNISYGLGTNEPSSNHKSSPVQTVAGGTNWKVVGAGNHTIALTY